MTVNAPAAAASVQSVGVTFAVLESLAQTPDAIGTSELARRLGMTKARVHRHLVTLRELGLVEKDAATDGYRLGWKSYRLGTAMVENFGLRRIAAPHLRGLHAESGETVAFARPGGPDTVTVIDTIEAAAGITITVRPGSVIPAATAALGRAMLAFDDNPPAEPWVEAVRAHWFAVAVNERIPGVAALAAPVFDEAGRAVASVGVIGSHAHITDPPRAALLAQVQATAARISEALRSSRWSEAPRAAA